jgi:hypothetical protein
MVLSPSSQKMRFRVLFCGGCREESIVRHRGAQRHDSPRVERLLMQTSKGGGFDIAPPRVVDSNPCCSGSTCPPPPCPPFPFPNIFAQQCPAMTAY